MFIKSEIALFVKNRAGCEIQRYAIFNNLVKITDNRRKTPPTSPLTLTALYKLRHAQLANKVRKGLTLAC